MNEQFMEAYEEMVQRLFKPTDHPLVHAALGIAGEAGEIVDCIKKNHVYGKALDMANLEEEVGDIAHYLIALCIHAGINFTDCLYQNMNKLNKRYPTGEYTNEDAIARKDKQ